MGKGLLESTKTMWWTDVYILHNTTGSYLGAVPCEAEGQLLCPSGLLSDLIISLSENFPSMVC